MGGGIRPSKTAHRVFMLSPKIKIVASGPKGIKLWQGGVVRRVSLAVGMGEGLGPRGQKAVTNY